MADIADSATVVDIGNNIYASDTSVTISSVARVLAHEVRAKDISVINVRAVEVYSAAV